jgi:DNA-binding MarR family transcriptional regulator
MKKADADPLKLSWEEIGFLCEGLSFASRPFRATVKSVTAEYSLGPRGAWIIVLIASGQVVFPLDVTKVFRVGRSLITAELTRLTEAGLITYRKSGKDRRRVELALTPLGETAFRRVKAELTKMVAQRFSSYTREEVLLCARMLHDFTAGVRNAPPSEEDRQAHKRSASSSRSRRRPARA